MFVPDLLSRAALPALIFLGFAWPGLAQQASKPLPAGRNVPVPRHDPADQLFRCAPMPAATRSVVIPLATNLHIAFDAALLRTHVAWSGAGLNLFGPPYHNSSDRFMCDFDGPSLWTTPQVFPWSSGKKPAADLPERPPGARFRGINTQGGIVTLLYDVVAGDQPVRIRETPRAEPIAGQTAVVRRFEIEPCREDLFLLVHSSSNAWKTVDPRRAQVERGDDLVIAAVRGDATLTVTLGPVSYPVRLWIEKDGRGPGIEAKTEQVNGQEGRVYVKIPARRRTAEVELVSVVVPKPEAGGVLAALIPSKPSATVNAVLSRGKPPAPPVFSAEKNFFPRLDGDKSYKVEHFPLPKEIDLRVTGMDFLPNGDLLVCTWSGEIYVVEHAQSDVRMAKYRRFACGLMEPMGVSVVGEDIYVLQKSELTRVRDTDGDGEADAFETINNDWGFTGRYNAFAMGPLVDRAGDFMIFLGGNGGFWDVRYMGWAFKVSRDGSRIDSFCSGLRVPQGYGFFGPQEDVFVTENQGNWIGACKLNHLQRGRFYGYPASWPAPAGEYEKTKTFAPPAVWFPYTLAKSTSCLAEIKDDRLGPFRGQLLVGDYQLSVITHVMLEKVNGEWQGAVWPFARGFLSGINRLVIGPDGKVYVGGGKGAHWAGAVGPQAWSLDRLTFTGHAPFEVRQVRAMPDGFELFFTEPVDPEAAEKPESYDAAQYTYRYHAKYGSPEMDHDGKENSSTEIRIAKASVSEDRMKVRLHMEGLRPGYVTMVRSLDVVNAAGASLRHDTFWYTLNQIPSP